MYTLKELAYASSIIGDGNKPLICHRPVVDALSHRLGKLFPEFLGFLSDALLKQLQDLGIVAAHHDAAVLSEDFIRGTVAPSFSSRMRV